MKLSFIIPTMNEEEHVSACLEEIRAQAPDAEVIVVDAYSKDRTREIAREYGARVLLQKPRGAGPARNKGAEKAKGDILCFVDADAVLGKGWVERVRRIFSDPETVAASGPLRPLEDGLKHEIMYLLTANLFPRITAAFGFYQFQGPNMIFRKRTFLKMGGFRPGLMALEDNELGNRARKYGRVVWDPKLVVFSSTRRFNKNGYLRMTLKFWKAYLEVYLLKSASTSYSDRGG